MKEHFHSILWSSSLDVLFSPISLILILINCFMYTLHYMSAYIKINQINEWISIHANLWAATVFLCAHITSSHTFENVIQKINRRLNIYHIICTYIHKSFRREYNVKTPEEYKIDSHSINIFFFIISLFFWLSLSYQPVEKKEKERTSMSIKKQ